MGIHRKSEGSGAVLALDLGTYLGWAMRLPDGTLKSGETAFTKQTHDREGTRLWRFMQWLLGEIRNKGVDWVFFENVEFQSTQKQTRLWSGWLTCVLLAAEFEKIGVRGFGVSTIKLTASGQGNAGKARMQAASKSLFGLDRLPRENEADALCTLFTGELWLKGKLALSEKQKPKLRSRKSRSAQSNLL